VSPFTSLTLNLPGTGYTLQATGGGLAPGATAAFTVQDVITGVGLSNSSVPEFRPVGTLVGALSTAPGTGRTFTYSLVSGAGSADNGSFAISGNRLLTADAFDAGTRSSYSVRVRTTDQSGLSLDQPFTITITDDPALTLSGGTLTVTGTAGNDSFTFTPGGAQDSMTLNGQALAVDAASVSSGGVEFNGNGGSDSATLTTAPGGGSTLFLSPGGGTLSGAGYQVTLNKVGWVVASGHSGDRAYFSGSAGTDAFIGTPAFAYLYNTASGTNFFSEAVGFGVVLASGNGGGSAFLYGAPSGGDVFVDTSAQAYLYGAGFFNQANRFQTVVATAGAGTDQAYLFGGANSAFVGTPTYSYLHDGGGDWEQADGFGYLVAKATGVNSTAYLYGSAAGVNRFVVTPGLSYLTGPAPGGAGALVNYAEGFQAVVGTAGTGADVATLYGVPGNTFVATSTYALLTGAGLTGQANGFGSVYAYSGGGGQAYLYGTMTAADIFIDRGSYAELIGPAAFFDFAGGFASVWANPYARR
jgi:hypothetical protein